MPQMMPVPPKKYLEAVGFLGKPKKFLGKETID